MFKFLFILILLTSCASRNKIVIAHRGASGYLPEHTLAATALAHSWGVDYIEPDIVLTKDNVPVILHDIHIDTTTNVAEHFKGRERSDGRFYAIDFTLKELKKLNVSERFNYKTGARIFPDRFNSNKVEFKIPTLVEFIELVQGLNKTRSVEIGIYPEIKSPEFHMSENKDITKVVFKILSDYGYNKPGSKIYLQCFYLPTLKRLKQEFKTNIPLIFLIAENSWKESSLDYTYFQTYKGLREASKYIDGIGPYLNQLFKIDSKGNLISAGFVEIAKNLNLKVHPYTHRQDQLPKDIHSNKEYFDLIYKKLKVDGVFSDFGDIAIKYSRN